MANRIAGITVEIDGSTTKLQSALKEVNTEIKSTQTQLKDVEKLLKLDPSNTELLTQKQNRAKIFAPFAALRGHSDRLSEETGKLLRSNRTEPSEEEAAVLSDKLLQVKKGMQVTVLYFEPDTPGGSVGYNISLTGTVAEIDAIFRFLKINTGESNDKGEIVKTVKFDDLLDVTGDDIVDIDKFLGIGDCENFDNYTDS